MALNSLNFSNPEPSPRKDAAAKGMLIFLIVGLFYVGAQIGGSEMVVVLIATVAIGMFRSAIADGANDLVKKIGLMRQTFDRPAGPRCAVEVLLIPAVLYGQLVRRAKKRNVSVRSLMLEILRDWVWLQESLVSERPEHSNDQTTARRKWVVGLLGVILITCVLVLLYLKGRAYGTNV
jgi:hypothetical protein